jgi:hypothetical protein
MDDLRPRSTPERRPADNELLLLGLASVTAQDTSAGIAARTTQPAAEDHWDRTAVPQDIKFLLCSRSDSAYAPFPPRSAQEQPMTDDAFNEVDDYLEAVRDGMRS